MNIPLKYYRKEQNMNKLTKVGRKFSTRLNKIIRRSRKVNPAFINKSGKLNYRRFKKHAESLAKISGKKLTGKTANSIFTEAFHGLFDLSANQVRAIQNNIYKKVVNGMKHFVSWYKASGKSDIGAAINEFENLFATADISDAAFVGAFYLNYAAIGLKLGSTAKKFQADEILADFGDFHTWLEYMRRKGFNDKDIYGS